MNTKYIKRYANLAMLLLGSWVGCSKNTPTAPVSSVPSTQTAIPGSTGSTPGRKIVAKVNDAVLTEDELNIVPEVSQIRTQAAEQWIRDTLIKQLVQEKGKASAAELKASVIASVAPVTEEEARNRFEEAQKRPQSPFAGKPFEPYKDMVMAALNQEKQNEAFEEFLDKMRAQRSVVVQVEESVYRVPTEGPSKGPQDAKITIVEFSDFQCPFCARGRQTMEEVLKKYGNKVRLVFRDFPMSFHDKAQKAAEAGQCAHKQGKFWAMHDWMFDHQDELDVEKLKQAAKEMGLDKDKFSTCLDSGETADLVKNSLAIGQKNEVKGTPAFFINGRLMAGAYPLAKFIEKIDQLLAMK